MILVPMEVHEYLKLQTVAKHYNTPPRTSKLQMRKPDILIQDKPRILGAGTFSAEVDLHCISITVMKRTRWVPYTNFQLHATLWFKFQPFEVFQRREGLINLRPQIRDVVSSHVTVWLLT